jgi:hypothetical protein
MTLSRNYIIFLILTTPSDVFAYPLGYAYPRLKTAAIKKIIACRKEPLPSKGDQREQGAITYGARMLTRPR